jgi:hypothetical protein
MEVHPALASEVAEMVRKKIASAGILEAECPELEMKSWHWIAPPGREIYFAKNDPAARVLAAAGIEFPEKILIL